MTNKMEVTIFQKNKKVKSVMSNTIKDDLGKNQGILVDQKLQRSDSGRIRDKNQ